MPTNHRYWTRLISQNCKPGKDRSKAKQRKNRKRNVKTAFGADTPSAAHEKHYIYFTRKEQEKQDVCTD